MKVFYAREDNPTSFEDCSGELAGITITSIHDLLKFVVDDKNWDLDRPSFYVIDGILHIRGYGDPDHSRWCEFRFDDFVLDEFDLLALEKLNVTVAESTITGSNLWECIQ